MTRFAWIALSSLMLSTVAQAGYIDVFHSGTLSSADSTCTGSGNSLVCTWKDSQPSGGPLLDFITHHISADVTLPAGATLKINKGSRIYFDGDYELLVQGTLEQAPATSFSTTTTFSSSTDPADPARGSWKGVRLVGASVSDGLLENLRIRGASTGLHIEGVAAALTLSNVTVSAAQSYGVYLRKTGDVSLEDLDIQGVYSPTHTGGWAVYYDANGTYGSDITISDSVIGVSDNGVYGYDAGLLTVKNTSLSMIDQTAVYCQGEVGASEVDVLDNIFFQPEIAVDADSCNVDMSRNEIIAVGTVGVRAIGAGSSQMQDLLVENNLFHSPRATTNLAMVQVLGNMNADISLGKLIAKHFNRFVDQATNIERAFLDFSLSRQ